MKLALDQEAWFTEVQREWSERIQPTASTKPSEVFDVADRVPEVAVRDARVFGSRSTTLKCFPIRGVIAEIGTQAGHFARRILDQVDPERLHLFDLEFDTLRSSNPDVAADPRVELHLGDSSAILEQQPDGSFDLIYIDGDHAIDGVRRDTACAIRKVKAEGLLVFNDYTVWSPLEMTDYGVVPVVNALLVSGDWQVVYLALHPLMYCDIAISRVPGSVA